MSTLFFSCCKMVTETGGLAMSKFSLSDSTMTISERYKCHFSWIFKVLMTVTEFSAVAVAKRCLLGWVLFSSKGYHGSRDWQVSWIWVC